MFIQRGETMYKPIRKELVKQMAELVKTMPYYIAVEKTGGCALLHCTALYLVYCITLYHTVQYCAILYFIALHYTYYTLLWYTVLYSTILDYYHMV